MHIYIYGALSIVSSGMGLSIIRLTAKAHGGDCGVNYYPDSKLFKLWFY